MTQIAHLHQQLDAVGLVDATPIGMTGVSDSCPIDLELLHTGLWVGDVIYRPRETTLIRAAEARGCRTFGGARMAVGLAAVSFELFTGRRADPETMLATFDRLQPHAAGE